jgi:uncharacterized phiE125 gp8 family phage protein
VLVIDNPTLALDAVGPSTPTVQVQMIAGYGPDATTVPPTIIQAIMMTAAFLYEHRGDAGGELPQAVQWLLDRDRLYFLG